MSKITAVEWLLEQCPRINTVASLGVIEQAKAMEKEQIEDGYQAGLWCPNHLEITKPWAEQYYNETYGTK